MLTHLLFALMVLATLTGHALADGPKDFDFTDPKGTNALSLFMDAAYEPVVGTANGISGKATFDPAHPEKTTGTIIVDVESVKFTNDGYTGSVQNYGLQKAKFPTITCALKKVVSVRTVKKNVFEGSILTNFTMKGVTKPVTIPINVAYFPGAAYDRDAVNDGDLIVIRSTFTIKRSDFGVAKEVPLELTGDVVEVKLALVGTAGVKRRLPTTPPEPEKANAAPELTLNIDGKSVPIAERMAFHKVPGCSVAVVKDFKVVSVQHFGTTGSDTAMFVNEKTLFPVGTMGGPVACTIALHAALEKQIDLDADINTYLKRWKMPRFSNTSRAVTVRDLMTNRSGLAYGKYLGYDPNKPLPTLVQILQGESPAKTPPVVPIAAPGEAFKLASENMVVLQVVLEDAMGKAWSELFADTFGPTESLYQAFPSTRTYIRFAKGFDDEGRALPDGGLAYPELAASGLWTSANEYAQFLSVIMASAAGKGEEVLPTEWAKKLFEVVVPPANGKDGNTWAFGIDGDTKRPGLYRGGNTQGYYAHTNLRPETGDAIIVLTNRNLCWKFANEVRDSLSKSAGW